MIVPCFNDKMMLKMPETKTGDQSSRADLNMSPLISLVKYTIGLFECLTLRETLERTVCGCCVGCEHGAFALFLAAND